MPYRKLNTSLTWHWCHNCSGWPAADFRQREDKPQTWGGQSLCEECAGRDCLGTCQHSVTLRTGLLSDVQDQQVALHTWEDEGGHTNAPTRPQSTV